MMFFYEGEGEIYKKNPNLREKLSRKGTMFDKGLNSMLESDGCQLLKKKNKKNKKSLTFIVAQQPPVFWFCSIINHFAGVVLFMRYSL